MIATSLFCIESGLMCAADSIISDMILPFYPKTTGFLVRITRGIGHFSRKINDVIVAIEHSHVLSPQFGM